jgi:hypothetical protein
MLILVAVMLLSMNARAQGTTGEIWEATAVDTTQGQAMTDPTVTATREETTMISPVTTAPKWDTTTTKIVTTTIPYTTTPKTSVIQKSIASLFFFLNKN